MSSRLLSPFVRRHFARCFTAIAMPLVCCSIAKAQGATTLPDLHDRTTVRSASSIMVYVVSESGEPFTEKFSMRLIPSDFMLNRPGFRDFARSTAGGRM